MLQSMFAFFVVQKVMAHVNNVVLHNLHKYKIYIIWTQILMQRQKTFRCELKKKKEIINFQTCVLVTAAVLNTATACAHAQ